ncbi:MAG TPA: nucleotide disphospho-sugar-binding domain-containing protein [Gemmataceae bacterium]|nr:nucleotide disphospho-sugar-binding domain-containing protein [Gemmataceae bacterium]
MSRDPILVRVDANPRTGYEHLNRCLTFAAALQRRRRPTYFLSQLEPAALGLAIKRAGNEWLDADSLAGSPEDLIETVQEARRLGPAAVIVDTPQASPGYLAELGGAVGLVVVLDHHAATPFPSQLVINPLLGPGKENYEFAPATQILMGQRYALVRPEIRRLRPGRAQEPPVIQAANGKATSTQYRAMVALGEDDPNQQAMELAKYLLNVPRIARVDVVARSYHPDLAVLQTLAASYPARLEIAVEPAEVAARVVRCHFAITSGSGWSLELACVGVPQLVIVQNEAHWPTAQRLEEEGCATCLGWHANVSPATVRQAVQNLLNDPLERQAMARCARKLIDGRGPDRLVTALEVMLHPSRMMDFSEAA